MFPKHLVLTDIFNACTVLVLVVLRFYVALAIFKPYHDLEAGDDQSLKS